MINLFTNRSNSSNIYFPNFDQCFEIQIQIRDGVKSSKLESSKKFGSERHGLAKSVHENVRNCNCDLN